MQITDEAKACSIHRRAEEDASLNASIEGKLASASERVLNLFSFKWMIWVIF